MLRDLVLKNRSYRRFDQDASIAMDTLKELVDLARCSASAANLQPLKYMLANEPSKNNLIFSKLRWASYLKDWGGPVKGEQPSAYIIVLGDKEISESINCDHGIACQSILLGAVEKGLGGCILASVKRDELRKALDIPAKYDILLVIAMGVPREQVVLDALGTDGSIKYWRDETGVHHVPKRSLDEIIVGNTEPA